MLSKIMPINVTYDLPDSEFSGEKRLITAEFEKFFLVSTYVVNSGNIFFIFPENPPLNYFFSRSRIENIGKALEVEQSF